LKIIVQFAPAASVAGAAGQLVNRLSAPDPVFVKFKLKAIGLVLQFVTITATGAVQVYPSMPFDPLHIGEPSNVPTVSAGYVACPHPTTGLPDGVGFV
jgi:hypothetical protein